MWLNFTKLYSDKKQSFTGLAHLRSKWVACGPRCKMTSCAVVTGHHIAESHFQHVRSLSSAFILLVVEFMLLSLHAGSGKVQVVIPLLPKG